MFFIFLFFSSFKFYIIISIFLIFLFYKIKIKQFLNKKQINFIVFYFRLFKFKMNANFVWNKNHHIYLIAYKFKIKEAQNIIINSILLRYKKVVLAVVEFHIIRINYHVSNYGKKDIRKKQLSTQNFLCYCFNIKSACYCHISIIIICIDNLLGCLKEEEKWEILKNKYLFFN